MQLEPSRCITLKTGVENIGMSMLSKNGLMVPEPREPASRTWEGTCRDISLPYLSTSRIMRPCAGFLRLDTIDTSGWIILCCEELSCALWEVHDANVTRLLLVNKQKCLQKLPNVSVEQNHSSWEPLVQRNAYHLSGRFAGIWKTLGPTKIERRKLDW